MVTAITTAKIISNSSRLFHQGTEVCYKKLVMNRHTQRYF